MACRHEPWNHCHTSTGWAVWEVPSQAQKAEASLKEPAAEGWQLTTYRSRFSRREMWAFTAATPCVLVPAASCQTLAFL